MTIPSSERPSKAGREPSRLPMTSLGTGGRSDASLTDLAAAAKVMRDAVKSKVYQGTPLGLKVRDYLSWKQDIGASPDTLRDYEATLARLALEHADLGIPNFEGQAGRKLVSDFWRRAWADSERNTRRKVLVHLKDFFRWLEGEDGTLSDDRVRLIRSPRRAEPERGELFSADEQNQILAACTRSRDRVAVSLLFGLGIRKGALRGFRLGDYDRARGTARFDWKGQRSHTLPIMLGLATMIEQHIDERMVAASARGRDWRSEYLLYPERYGPSWNPDLPKIRLLWEDRSKPLSETSMHRWWTTRLEDADVPHRRMHEARHTAISDKIRRGMRLEQAQLLAGHKSIATTVDVYGHVELSSLEDELRRQEQR